MGKKVKDIPISGHESHGGCTVDVRVLIYTATPLERAKVASPKLGSTPVVPWLSYSPLDPKFAGSNPAGVDGFFFQSVKILSMTPFGREVKPWDP